MSLTNVFIAADLNKFRVSKFTLSNKKSVKSSTTNGRKRGKGDFDCTSIIVTELFYYCFKISRIETVRKKFRLFYGSYSLYCKYNNIPSLGILNDNKGTDDYVSNHYFIDIL